MTTGLTLGKYAPFHRGHQFVIETALNEVDELVVIVYDCPETTPVPLTVRADWIRELYPDVEVIEGWTLPTGTGYDTETKRKHEEAVIDVLDRRNVDAFYSSEPYGEHMSEALDAEDRRVDPERETVPISATKIRENPYENREFVDARVYADLVTNVVLLGGPSTGKSTLAEALAEEFETDWMPEYGREYWDTHQIDRELTQAQLVEIAEGHLEQEDERLHESNEYLFTDTNAITTLLFSRRYHGDAPKRLRRLAERCATRYDVVFLCGTDIPYDDTWDRAGDDWRRRMQKQTRAFLDRHNIPYVVLEGSVEERVETAKRVLEQAGKYELERAVPSSEC